MDPREQLKGMLHNLINDNNSEAELTLHDYIVAKTREVSGFGQPAPADDEFDNEPSDDGDDE